MEMEAILNDNVVIPKRISNMSKGQRLAQIKKLEEVAAKEKKKFRRRKNQCKYHSTAPYLHELGHKYYEDCVHIFAKLIQE